MLKNYEGAIGVKTGFTKKTGRCLVSAARREGMTLICVTLNAPDDWRDHTALLDYGYENYCRFIFADTGEFKYELAVVGGVGQSVTLTNTAPLALTLPKSHSEAEYTVLSNHRFLYAPIEDGEQYATVTLRCLGESAESPLVTEKAIPRVSKQGFWSKVIK